MMGCGNKLVKPMSSPGQFLSGYILGKIFGSKAIYLRPSTNLVDIKIESSDEDSDSPTTSMQQESMSYHENPAKMGTKRKRKQEESGPSNTSENGSAAIYSSFINLMSDSDDDNDLLISVWKEEEDNLNLAIEASMQDLNELAMNQLPSYFGLFEGREGYMMFSHNIKLVEENKFFLAGRLVGLSLTQGGPGICCFHPSVYHLMCGIQCDLSKFDMTSIVDTDFSALVAQLKSVQTQEMFDTLTKEKGDYIASMGYPEIYSTKAEDKDRIVASLLKYHLFYRVTAEMMQFTKGLNEAGGLWETIKQHPRKFELCSHIIVV
ncbi:uncharacterized protein LOC114528364 [Dendronephthya gigantea]|uniref:uncharacterized protein LOC114528364 n=1 Tax=Dendronephthya gigantea TaxID=151771 RepID=UPI00106C6F77|nr:uncharacterized protein LOC114528364 [Dendronephthya gigantea]XP_028405787.1 uncharacterized protein LOC114528364 [Dendronephthya gigantea]